MDRGAKRGYGIWEMRFAGYAPQGLEMGYRRFPRSAGLDMGEERFARVSVSG